MKINLKLGKIILENTPFLVTGFYLMLPSGNDLFLAGAMFGEN